jgi:DNA-binding response OmpR family regulator
MKKILVIAVAANSTDFLEKLASTLARSGLELMITSPGLGLEVIDTVSPDVAIVRDNSPQLDGYQLCQEIRHLFDLPLILLGDKPETGTYSQALEAGADFYMTWPLHYLELAARVRALLRRYNRREVMMKVEPSSSG